MPGTEPVTVSEIRKRYGVSLRTVRGWIKGGLAHVATRPSRHGQPTKLYRPADIARLMGSTPGKARAAYGRATKRGAPGSTVVPSPVAVEAKTADPEVLPPDELLAMLKRLRQAELTSAALWARCVRSQESNPVEQSMLQKSWRDCADQVRRLEKELPEILYRKGRYVDVVKVGALVTEAVTAMCAELDQVGLSVAETCVGRSAREIRALVDEAVNRARQHISSKLGELCQRTL